jgi:hypothetical protein
MSRLNADASALALEHGVRGATDITGYGLLGHGLEMAEASKVRLVLQARAIPFLAGARAYVHAGCIPGGSADNQVYFGPRVRFDPSIDEYSRSLLFDAQTSGGLLLCLPATSQRAFSRPPLAQTRFGLWKCRMAASGRQGTFSGGRRRRLHVSDRRLSHGRYRESGLRGGASRCIQGERMAVTIVGVGRPATTHTGWQMEMPICAGGRGRACCGRRSTWPKVDHHSDVNVIGNNYAETAGSDIVVSLPACRKPGMSRDLWR